MSEYRYIIHIYVYMDAFCQYLYFNDMRHRVLCLFLPRYAITHEKMGARKREKKKGKEQERSDGWLTRLYLPRYIFFFFQK